MLIHRLRQFAAVADQGSIAGAASLLRVAQPALSRQMRALEEEIGTPLFDRTTRGVQLTAAGALLHADAVRVLAALDEAVLSTLDAHVGATGVVRLGVGRMALDSRRVSAALARVRRALPRVRVELIETPSLDQARALRARELDVAIGLADFEGDALVRRELLYEERIDSALVATSHPLALRTRVSVEELRSHPYLSLSRPMDAGYPRMYEALRRAGIDRIEECNSAECVYALVAAGYGWSMASRSLHVPPPLGTTVVRLEGLTFGLPVSLRWRGRDRSRALHNVLEVLRAACRNPDDPAPAPPAKATRPHESRGARGAGPAAAGVEVHHLQAFVAAVEERSLSGAAVRLHLTQSGISRRVHALERAVGCRLVDRAAHGVLPTNAGEALRVEADRVLRLLQQATSRARQAAGGISGVCRIGALPPELTGNLQAVALRRLAESFPHVRVEVSEMLSEAQVRALREGRIDIALAGGFPEMEVHPDLASVQLVEDVIDGVLLPEGHPLLERAWITAADLAGEPFLFTDRARGRRLYDGVLAAFERLGAAVAVAATHSGPRSVWRAMAGGYGWTIASRSQRARPPAGLVGVPLEGLHLTWGISLFWRRNEGDPTVREVLEVFRTTRNPEVAVVVATVRAPQLAGAS